MSTAPSNSEQLDAGDDDLHRLVGTTVSSAQRYWYEVHEHEEPEMLNLLAVDRVPHREMSYEELDELMEKEWSVEYHGQTGELEVSDDV